MPIEKAERIILENYIRDKLDWHVLFPSNKGYNQPITYRQMQTLIVKYGLECGIKNIGTHTPRKTSAYHLFMETGGDIEEVKELLAHDTRRDTYSYIDAVEESKIFRARKTNSPFKMRRNIS